MADSSSNGGVPITDAVEEGNSGVYIPVANSEAEAQSYRQTAATDSAEAAGYQGQAADALQNYNQAEASHRDVAGHDAGYWNQERINHDREAYGASVTATAYNEAASIYEQEHPAQQIPVPSSAPTVQPQTNLPLGAPGSSSVPTTSTAGIGGADSGRLVSATLGSTPGTVSPSPSGGALFSSPTQLSGSASSGGADIPSSETGHAPAPAALTGAPVGNPTVVPAPAPSGSSAGGNSYVVKSGDTMTAIAEMYHVSLPALAQANSHNVPDPNLILPGQHITIPAGEGGAPSVTSPSPEQNVFEVLKPSTDPLKVNHSGSSHDIGPAGSLH